jgi:hypothetical protein
VRVGQGHPDLQEFERFVCLPRRIPPIHRPHPYQRQHKQPNSPAEETSGQTNIRRRVDSINN